MELLPKVTHTEMGTTTSMAPVPRTRQVKEEVCKEKVQDLLEGIGYLMICVLCTGMWSFFFLMPFLTD